MVHKTLKHATPADISSGAYAHVARTVDDVIADIRARGDAAVREYSQRFDGWAAESFLLDEAEIKDITSRVPDQEIADIERVQANVRRFAEAQLASLSEFEVETAPGIRLGQRHVPVAAAGAYVPGGRYPLTASAHMTIVTAKVAGVPRVAACTPPIRGEVPAATIAAMHLAGADEIYLLGGIQAVAALAVGTETIRPVNLIAGPGQCVRRRGQAEALRRGWDRPVRRADRNTDRGRRDRRSLHRRGRSAQPGRTRTRLTRCVDLHVGIGCRAVDFLHRRAATRNAHEGVRREVMAGPWPSACG